MERPARLILGAVGAVGIAAAGACGGSYTPPMDSENGSGGAGNPDMPYKRLLLSLEVLPPGNADDADAGSVVDLWLIQTYETGSTRREDLGELPWPCTVWRNPPDMAMKPLFAIECTGGEGMRVRLVHLRDQIVVLRAPGVTGDDFDFEESQRINLPMGVRVLTE